MADLLQPATTLEDVYKTLSPEPLDSGAKLKAFYTDDVNAIRGGDKIAPIAYMLGQHYNNAFYRAFLMGHQGVGKSTELARLVHQVQFQFRPVRFSATKDLNPTGFTPFDVLLVMLVRLMKEVQECGGRMPSDSLLLDVQQWFATTKSTLTRQVDTSLEAKGEAGAKTPGLLASVINFGVNFSATRKYAATRQTTTERTEAAFIPELIGLVNKLLGECSSILMDVEQKEWLFIGEDFDKQEISPEQIEELFLRFGSIFRELRAHMIFTIPISLVYSDRVAQLPFGRDRIHRIVDTPVFLPDHTPDTDGRNALAEVLAKRMSLDLFDAGQKERLIVASGGNLRDLFSMVTTTAVSASLRRDSGGKIGKPDVDRVINDLRTDYRGRLSISAFDDKQIPPVTYEEKAKRLIEIYKNGQNDPISDAVMFSLFRSRAVQEFNGEGWYGIPPIIVEILKRQGKIEANAQGNVPGGVS